ncbi:hypothetical protein QBC35DRAFT_489370 [Podospora australis]|uniref:Integral membrane protein n=1 Tax=Podospora australis TaxID=1536484 RepID=A0AAN7ALP1_9PEZI|nr:hypothetical protein QBC35DRAFT_489370 [Podospora australis]
MAESRQTTGTMPSITNSITAHEIKRQQQQKRHFSDSHYDNAAHSHPPITKFFHPNTHFYRPQTRFRGSSQSHVEKKGHEHVYHVWRSRDNRKGRHAVVIFFQKEKDEEGGGKRKKWQGGMESTNSLRQVARGVAKMATRFPVWDVSWLVAMAFVWGSIVWCINGCFVYFPLAAPRSEFEGETDIAAGILAFIGATIFEIGSVWMVLEAVNENRTDCFGWALEEAGHPTLHHTHEEHCQHSSSDRKSLLPSTAPERKWSWWPTAHELRTHYIKELGFLAAITQLVGATIFWMAGFTSIPPIYDSFSSVRVMNGTYWLPQVVGGCGFIISAIFIMLEVQERWWKPNLKSLGWHIGFWNLVGAIGFTLCGALGFGVDDEAVEYASIVSTFVGSWAFLTGSVIQWYECLNKYSLSIERRPSWVRSSESLSA